MERCFACDRQLGKTPRLVDTRDGQTVYVGSECFKHIEAAAELGWQPSKGGPRLYLLKSDGMTPTKTVFERDVHKCQRCPHVWMSRKGSRPERCPRCKSMLWDTSKKQKRGPKPGTTRPRKDEKRGPRSRKSKKARKGK